MRSMSVAKRGKNEKERRIKARGGNERLNNVNTLSNNFSLPFKRHSSCFRVVAVITQLNIENGQPLFQIEYYDDI